MSVTDVKTLAAALGGEIVGPQSVLAPGPGHSPRDRSLSVTLTTRNPDGFVVNSFSPKDDWKRCRDYVRDRLRFPAMCCDEVRQRVEGGAPPQRNTVFRRDPVALWDAAVRISGAAETYLRRRGITVPLPHSLRSGVSFRGGIPQPTLVAAVQSPTGEVCAVHCTAVTRTGQKADVATPKRSIGPLGQGAVRLGMATDVLAIAEGIETGLSVYQLFGLPVWVSLGSQRLAKLAIPPSVKELVIYADNDDAGRLAAVKAAIKYRDMGLEVDLEFPDPFEDFNDLIRPRYR